jgi:transposase
MARRSCVNRLVDDVLWELVEPLIPARPRPRRGRSGRPRVPDRAALAGIVFVLKTGISWNELPQELGCGSGVTCWRRLRQWQRAGVWERLHRAVLDRLGQHDLLDWSRAAVDSVSVRAKRRGELTGPSPTDRGKAGTKYHVLCDRNGLPLHAVVTGANAHDSTMLLRCWIPTPESASGVDSPGGPDGDRASCTPIRATTTRGAAATCAGAGSGCGSPAAGSRTPLDSGGCGGSWSARCRGCSTSGAWQCATTAPRTPCLRCCRWPAP